MKIIVFGSQFQGAYKPQAGVLHDFLSRCTGVEIAVEAHYAHYLAAHFGFDEQAFELFDAQIPSADVAISLGGDGTFLHTAARIGAMNIPILGINAGHLGFLAEVSDDEIDRVMSELLLGQYKIEERTVLQATLSNGTSDFIPFALNEVAVLKQDLSSMINITTYIDDELLHTYRADGLLVSTPTGSTAYALSVGGPILAPYSPNWLVMPVASHSLTVRPLVIPDDCRIEMRVSSRSGSYLLSLDGRSMPLSDEVTIKVTKAAYKVKSIQPLDHTFFKTLKNKLMWGADVRE